MGNLTQCESTGFREHPAYGFFHSAEQSGSGLVTVEKRIEKDKKALEVALRKLNGKKQLKHPNIGIPEVMQYGWWTTAGNKNPTAIGCCLATTMWRAPSRSDCKSSKARWRKSSC